MGLPPNLQLMPVIRSRLLWRPLSCSIHHLFASFQVFRDTMHVRPSLGTTNRAAPTGLSDTGKDGRAKSQGVFPPADATPSCWDDPWADLWCNYQNEQRLTSQALADTTISAISGMPPGSTHSLITFLHVTARTQLRSPRARLRLRRGYCLWPYPTELAARKSLDATSTSTLVETLRSTTL